jgi:hypothetical protein
VTRQCISVKLVLTWQVWQMSWWSRLKDQHWRLGHD